MTNNREQPIPRLRQPASDRHVDRPYEWLASIRKAAAQVLDSGILWTHERTHMEEVIDRIDATVSLKRQREEYWAGKRKRETG
jgi:hypothetical protein